MQKWIFGMIAFLAFVAGSKSALASEITFKTIGYEFPTFSPGSRVTSTSGMKTFEDIGGTKLFSKPTDTTITVNTNDPGFTTFHWFGAAAIMRPVQVRWSVTQLVSDGVNSTTITITGMAYVSRLGTQLSFDHSNIYFSLGGQNYVNTYSYTGGQLDPNKRGGIYATADPSLNTRLISAPVPETSTWLIVLSGMVMLGLAAHRNKFLSTK